MASVISHVLLRTDFYEMTDIFDLSGEEAKIYDYCIRKGALNNMGIFSENRGFISLKLKVSDDACYHFFNRHPKIIGFDPATHLIWVKKIYSLVDYGLTGEIWKQRKDRLAREVRNIQPR